MANSSPGTGISEMEHRSDDTSPIVSANRGLFQGPGQLGGQKAEARQNNCSACNDMTIRLKRFQCMLELYYFCCECIARYH